MLLYLQILLKFIHIKNFQRMLLIPDNLQLLSMLIDMTAQTLLDQEYHKVVDREMKLADSFLEDRLSKMIFVKLGILMTKVTSDDNVYKKSSDILHQMNQFLTTNNLKTLQDFSVSMSRILTEKVPNVAVQNMYTL